MKHWSIRKLLATGFAAPLAMIGLLVGAFFYNLALINDQVTKITRDNIPGLTLINQAMEHTLTYRVLTMQHIIADDAATKAAIDEKCDALAAQIVATLAHYEQ